MKKNTLTMTYTTKDGEGNICETYTIEIPYAGELHLLCQSVWGVMLHRQEDN
ncbi:MAG: hypothetical protein V3R78_09960 [Thermodesulfobacteriota bacterium]